MARRRARPADPDGSDFVTLPTRVYPAPDAPDGLFLVTYRKLLPITAPRARYPGFRPGVWTLKAGTVRREGARPLPVDVIFERDVPMTLRDGTTIFTDVFRPVGAAEVPAIFSWSPYGKTLGGQWLDDLPKRSGVPLDRVSELQRFEGADPAYWCAHGYAVVNPDPRGALKSQGNVNYWGRQLAEDGYDVVEWTASRPWCSGAVVMSGNSWLAVSQWFIAAEQPPHLVAIAPWEGLVDQGPAPGIPAGVTFGEIVIQTLAGAGYIEDQPRMTLDQPLMNAFWRDRRARVELISIPAYIVASYTNMAHTTGTFDAWRHIGSTQKWLRIHNTQEWADYYDPERVEDLRRFFDHYAKHQDNGWETTPAVRMSVLDPGGADIVDRPEATYPPPRSLPTTLFLQHRSLTRSPADTAASVSHAATSGSSSFLFSCDKTVEIGGYAAVRLWLEADGSDDMDIVVSLRKRPGRLARMKEKLPGPGAGNAMTGMLRVSYRELDEERSTPPHHPVLAMQHRLVLAPGEVVAADVALSPMVIAFRPGDVLELTVSAFRFPPFIPLSFGRAMVPFPADGLTFPPGGQPDLRTYGGKPEDEGRRRATTPPATTNNGRHILHYGGRYDSQLLFYEIPAG